MLDRQFFRPLHGVAVCVVRAFNRPAAVVILKNNPPATGRGWSNTYAVNSLVLGSLVLGSLVLGSLVL